MNEDALKKQVEILKAVIEKRDEEIRHLRAQVSALGEHGKRELQLQRSMLTSLHSERSAFLDQIDALRAQLAEAGADSARVAISRAARLLVRAVRRRVRLTP